MAVAIVALFAATSVEAEYSGEFDTLEYTWFEHLGCRVEIATPFPDVIDCATGKCSEYTWEVTCPTSHSDILIRRDMEARIVKALCDGSDCTSLWSMKRDGTGESSTDFGKFLIWNIAGKWNYGWSDSDPHTLSLILTGDDLGSDPTDFLIKHGQVLKYGPIQGPAPKADLNPFIPTTNSETGTGAGGQIPVRLEYVNNELVNVTPLCDEGPGCYSGILTEVNDETLQYLEGTLTYGDNTTTCWPLSPPFCVCTRRPCP